VHKCIYKYIYINETPEKQQRSLSHPLPRTHTQKKEKSEPKPETETQSYSVCQRLSLTPCHEPKKSQKKTENQSLELKPWAVCLTCSEEKKEKKKKEKKKEKIPGRR